MNRKLECDVVWNDVEFARVLMAREREEIQSAQRRERAILATMIATLASALVAVCWVLR